MVIYVVEEGDSVYSIANKYGLDANKIISDNQIPESEINNLVVGRTLVLLVDNLTHTVESGDSLYALSRYYNVSIDDILLANPKINNPNIINVGDSLTIPFAFEKLGNIEVNGFMLPGISDEVLNATLPSLTYLSIFSYNVNADGTLQTIDDENLIAKAKAKKVAPLMVITNIDNGFSSELAHIILTDMDVQENLINNVLDVLNQKGYYGINVDFEYIFPADRIAYNNFIERLAEVLRTQGYFISTSLAPKISDTQPGTLYEAHDYAVHGELVDKVVLMTYEWGYLYGDPQAVSPVPQIRQVLTYATEVIPSQKILMGMSNYGYDWTLPFVEGTAARILTNNQAIEIARETGSFIKFDNVPKAPYFNYYTDTNQHIVWFDDARSVYYRLLLVDEFDLVGISYWTINNLYNQGLLLLNSMYNVIKVI